MRYACFILFRNIYDYSFDLLNVSTHATITSKFSDLLFLAEGIIYEAKHKSKKMLKSSVRGDSNNYLIYCQTKPK